MRNFPSLFLTFRSYYRGYMTIFQPILQLLNIKFTIRGYSTEIFNLTIIKVHKKLIFL